MECMKAKTLTMETDIKPEFVKQENMVYNFFLLKCKF